MTRKLFVAWRSSASTGGHWGPIGQLEHGPGGYRFQYTRGARMLRGFQPFPEMPELDVVYESDELFPLFTNRLLSPSRPEYQAYLAWAGFDPSHPPDPIAILAVTEGLRATDQLEIFPCPRPDREGCYQNKFFVHGIRHVPAPVQARMQILRQGDRLLLKLDDDNPVDPYAVAVHMASDPVRIGFVPRYLAREVRVLASQCDPKLIDLQVERVNAGAPLQQRLLCRMRACWPENFAPCSADEFQPIPSELPVVLS